MLGPSGPGPSSGWMGEEKLFSTPEFAAKYETVEISLLTPKFTLVPEEMFSESGAREALAAVCTIAEEDQVSFVPVPSRGAVIIFSPSRGGSLAAALSRTVVPASGKPAPVLPEIYYIIRELDGIKEFNKIVASWRDGWLHLAIAQGEELKLANVFRAPDFVTAQYYIFLCLKQLQLNPEVSTLYFRTPLDQEDQLSLYRYLNSVVVL